MLLGCDPLADFPDRTLARAALDKVERVICISPFLDSGAARADVVLPPTVWGEQVGTTTNLEGRVLRLARKVTADGSALDSWRIAGELASRLGTDFDLETTDEVQDEIAQVAPAFAGVDASLLRRARDGVVLPVADHVDELAFGPAAPGAGVSWEPIRPQAADAERRRTPRRPPRRAGRRRASRTASCAARGHRQRRRRSRSRSTPTVCASWPAARSTDRTQSSSPRLRWPDSPTTRRACSSTRATAIASVSPTATRSVSRAPRDARASDSRRPQRPSASRSLR